MYGAKLEVGIGFEYRIRVDWDQNLQKYFKGENIYFFIGLLVILLV